MSRIDKTKIKLIRLQIGCIIKFERLNKGLSQEQLSVLIESTSTTIGRIERAEHSSNWEILMQICEELDIPIGTLFKLEKKEGLLLIVKNTIKLEQKLTEEKRNYYKSLEKIIERYYSLLQ